MNGQAWTFAYSPLGRLQSTTDPLKQTTKYTYDNLGRVSQITYADGVTSTVRYDASNNPMRVAYSDGTQFAFAYDAQDNLIGANDVFLVRDAEGRIVNSIIGDAQYGATYSNAGRLKTATYPLGGDKSFTVKYGYNGETGLLTSVSDSLTNAQIDFTYDKDDRLIGMARSNKVNTALTWNNASRLTGIKEGSVIDAQYALDAAGQVTSAKITAPLDPSSALAGATTQGSPLQYNAASQISSPGYTYDTRGRLTASPSNKFTWDGASQVVGIGPTNLTYNGLGEIASRTDGTATVRYAYNYALGLDPIVAETDDANKPLRYYVWTPAVNCSTRLTRRTATRCTIITLTAPGQRWR